ncbi:MAG: uracil-DNA glycosylase [Alphaproteobacteria bacterium]|nr:uracil-DNA glycosylase [Alphaproteobacteria bacterium]
MASSISLPDGSCRLCPRLAAFRDENNVKFPDWHNAPVTPFGSLDAELLIVGLAPGLKGANRTGRPFTGDYAGDLLYDTLLEFGFAKGAYAQHADDGFELTGCRVTNGVRCVPPQNKPVGAEINACRPFLNTEIEAMPNLKCILTLGGIAHNTLLRAFGQKVSAWKFAHNAVHVLPDLPVLVNSYHCSRYNTNTGRLTEEMFHDVFRSIRKLI